MQIKLKPGNVDYDVQETMVTSQSSRGSSGDGLKPEF